MPRRPTWRYSAGEKRVNRVTVYERKDRACIYIDYKDGFGVRIQRPVKSPSGRQIPNTEEGRRLAVIVCEAVAREREQAVYRETAEAFGVQAPRTVDSLLEKMHADRGGSWSETYARDQARFRTFWSAKLGTLTLRTVNAATVEGVARREAKKRKWTPRTHGSYLRYLVDAFAYAEKKLKWIDAADNLSAVDIPSPRSQGVAYTLDELRRLLPALEKVDERAGWIGYVAWQTGRRLTAIRKLRKKDVLAGQGRAVLRFPRETDKPGIGGEAVVVGRAAALTEKLMARPGKYVLGTEPPTLDQCDDWMKAAEKRAKVTYVKRRSWHGIKRSFTTVATDLRLASKQSGTRQSTLATIYDQDWTEGKEGLAKALDSELSVPRVVPESENQADG